MLRMVLGGVDLSLGWLTWGPVEIGRAEGWKACAFNDQSIGCRDTHAPDGTVRIVWQEGKAMIYRMVREGFPFSTLRDSLGGVWERQILVQGNAVFTNKANGNRIVVPLHQENNRP